MKNRLSKCYVLISCTSFEIVSKHLPDAGLPSVSMLLETANQINFGVTVVDADNSLSIGQFSNNVGIAGAREGKSNCGTDSFLSLSQEPQVCWLCTNQNQPLLWYKSWSMMVRNHSPREWKDISKTQPGIFIGFLCFGFLVPQTSSCGNLTWHPQHHNPSMSMGIVLGSQKGSDFLYQT